MFNDRYFNFKRRYIKACRQNKTTKNYLYDNSWKEEIDEFSDCILNDNPVENGTSYDALKIMEMIFNIYKADRSWWKYFNNSRKPCIFNVRKS